MTSPKPYLLRAFYDWILDNAMTPFVVIDAKSEGVKVPADYVQDGKIVLNISPTASQALVMDKDQLAFNTRFQGNAREVFVPMTAIRAVYAKENGRGMVFPEEEGTESPAPTPPRKGPQLRVIK